MEHRVEHENEGEILENGHLENEHLEIESTLDEISRNLKSGETLILDVGYDDSEQSDEIYDKLVMRGYEVRRMTQKNRSQIVVSRR